MRVPRGPRHAAHGVFSVFSVFSVQCLVFKCFVIVCVFFLVCSEVFLFLCCVLVCSFRPACTLATPRRVARPDPSPASLRAVACFKHLQRAVPLCKFSPNFPLVPLFTPRGPYVCHGAFGD